MKRIVPLFLLLFVGNFLFSQTKFDFSGSVSLTSQEGFPSFWKNIATINIDGIDYVLTAGGNGTWTQMTGGVGNSMSLRKDGSGGDQVTIERKDQEPFRFYGIWLKHNSMYSPPFYQPPYYSITYNKIDDEPETYTNSDGATTATATISKDVAVTSVTIRFTSMMYFWIDDLIVGPASTEPEPFSVTASQTNVSCAGGSNGSASVSVTGGQAPYSYSWTGVENDGPTATGLAAGTYTCTVSDAGENVSTQTFNIEQPASSTITISAQPANKTISTGQSASFSVTAANATSYEWQVNSGSGFMKIVNGYPYSGASTSTLTIAAEAEIQSGSMFRCVLKNSCSEPVNSNSAQLLVLSNNALLQSFQITPGELNQQFSGETTEYSAEVAAATSEVFVAAFAYTGATVKINGTPFSDGSIAIPLQGGTNEIKVEVTAEDGTTKKTYYFSVNRPLAKVLSIERANSPITNAETVTYTVKLSIPVSGLSAENFSIQGTGTTDLYSIFGVTQTSETTYNVTINTGTGEGTLKLILSNVEGVEVPFQGIPFTGTDGYIIDKIAPTARGKNISVTLGSSGSVTISPSSLNDGSSDNYTSELNFTADKTTFTGEDLGQHTVALTVEDQAGNRSSTEVVVTVNKNLTSIASIEPIQRTYGDALNLPETVTVTYSDNSSATLPVKWNLETYTGRVGEYSLTGNITLPEFVTNSESLHYETDVVIAKKELTVGFEGRVSKVYDGNTTATINPEYYVLSGAVAEDDVHLNNPATGAFDTKNVGAEKKVTISGLALTGEDASNYFIESNQLVSFTGKITAKELSVQMNEEISIDKIYDGNNTATLADKNFVVEGVVEGDDISLEAYGAYSDKNAGENKAIVVSEFTIAGEDKANYNLTTTTASAYGTIAPKELTVTMSDEPILKTYDGTAEIKLPLEKLTLNTPVKGDDLSLESEAAYDNKNAGSEKPVTINAFKLIGEDKGNYQLMTEELATYGSILQKEISLELNAEPAITKVYDGNTSITLASENYSLKDVMKGDVVTVKGYANYDTKNAGDDKQITVNEFTLDGTDKNNYLLTTREAITEGRITRKEITVAAVATPAISKIYDGNNEATLSEENIQANGVVEGDAITVNGTATFSDKNAGEDKVITIEDFEVSGEEKDNYLLTTTTASTSGTIFRKKLNISLSEEPVTKVYDGSSKAILPHEKLVLNEQVKGDDLSLESEAAYDNKNAGSEKPVTINAFKLIGEDKGNYQLMTEELTTYGSILQKEISLELNAEPAISKVYDGNTSITLASENYSLKDILNGDVVTVKGFAKYDDKNAGDDKQITVNEFTLDGTDKNNYLLTTNEAQTKGNITQKELHVALVNGTGVTKTYDGTDEAIIAANNYEVTGTIKNDEIAINNPALGRFDDKHAGTSKMVFVTGLAPTGADAGNYKLASASVSAQIGAITPRDVVVNVDSKTKVYGKADPSLTYEVVNIVKGESLEGKPTRKKGNDVGEYLINLGDIKGGNDYNITHFQPGTLTITPAELTIVADSKTKDQGKPNPAFTFTYSGFVNGDNADDLQVTPVANTVAAATSPIGNYEITPSAAVSNNYHITFVKGKLTILPGSHDNSMKVWRTGAGIAVRVYVKEDQKSYAMMVTSTGQTIMVEQKMLKSGFNTFTLPLTHLASSTYVITVGSNKFKLAQRIDVK